MKHNFDASVTKDLAWQALSKAVWRYKMTYIILGDTKNNIREFEFYWPLPCTILTKNSMKVASYSGPIEDYGLLGLGHGCLNGKKHRNDEKPFRRWIYKIQEI